MIYKFGGSYFDTDIISLGGIPDNITNFMVLEDGNGGVNNALMKSQKNHPFFGRMLENLSKDFKPGIWAYNGPQLIGRTLKELCSYQDNDWHCKGFDMELLPISTAYPVHWGRMYDYFREGRFNYGNETFALHYWHHVLGGLNKTLKWNENQTLYQIFKQSCPLTEKSILRHELLRSFVHETK